ncbi:MAG: hypothetical protein KDC72_09350, partial [Bacteroidetes bacterium]|nr:hypothetical protein [Bacteroidota bacterium]
GHVCVNNGVSNDEVAIAGNCHGDPSPKYTGGLQGPTWGNKRNTLKGQYTSADGCGVIRSCIGDVESQILLTGQYTPAPASNGYTQPSSLNTQCLYGLSNCSIEFDNIPPIDFDIYMLSVKGSESIQFAYLSKTGINYVSNASYGSDDWSFSNSGFELSQSALQVGIANKIEVSISQGSTVEFTPTPNLWYVLSLIYSMKTTSINADASLKFQISARPLELALVHVLTTGSERLAMLLGQFARSGNLDPVFR